MHIFDTDKNWTISPKPHQFKVGLSDTTECPCGHKYESPEHYITQCAKYAEERQTLYDQMLQFIPNFQN